MISMTLRNQGFSSRDGEDDLALDAAPFGPLMGTAGFGEWVGAVDHDADGSVIEEGHDLLELGAAGANLCRRHRDAETFRLVLCVKSERECQEQGAAPPDRLQEAGRFLAADRHRGRPC